MYKDFISTNKFEDIFNIEVYLIINRTYFHLSTFKSI